MLTPPATPRSVHCTVLLRPIQNVVSPTGRRSVRAGACLTPRVIVIAEASRVEPSSALALTTAVLTKSRSPVARIVTITNASDPGARVPRSQVAMVPTEHSP